MLICHSIIFQVIIKLKSKHVGGAFSKKIKSKHFLIIQLRWITWKDRHSELASPFFFEGVVYGVCDEKSAWPYRKERENSEEVYFGLKTGQGLLEFKCKSKVHKQRWVDGVQSLLRQVNCFEAAKCSLGSLSLTNHRWYLIIYIHIFAVVIMYLQKKLAMYNLSLCNLIRLLDKTPTRCSDDHIKW